MGIRRKSYSHARGNYMNISLEKFKEWYGTKLTHWTDSAQQLLFDAYNIGLSYEWTESKLNNEYVEIYTRMLGRLQCKSNLTDVEKDIQERYKIILRNELETLIRYYCE